MKQRARPLSKKLEIKTYDHDKRVTFSRRLQGSMDEEAIVLVPLPLMYRLWHLGRAYDLPQLAHLHPTDNVSIGFIAAQSLAQDFELVASVVNDEALHHYLDQVVPFLKAMDTKHHVLLNAVQVTQNRAR